MAVPLRRIRVLGNQLAPLGVEAGEELILKEPASADAPGVAVLKVNRPKALNALNAALMAELTTKLKQIDADPSIRAVVITGVGDRAFAAGADIAEMNTWDFAHVTKENFGSAMREVAATRKPMVAAVNGFALGGGCELAMACDIVLASEKARFGQPEILLGVIPGFGGTQLLTRAVGKSKAMNWILTGDQFSADEAEKAGLVAKVLPADQLLPEAVKLAGRIANLSGPVTVAAKEAVNRAFDSALSEGVLFERRVFHGCFALEDRSEGMAAFLAKRDATWKHK